MALIVGVAGACRQSELVNLCVDDIEEKGSRLVVTIREPEGKKFLRCFMITNSKHLDYVSIYRKYSVLRPKNIKTPRFFLKYNAGKCIKQVVGINTFGRVPSMIAQYLEMPNPRLYTGHCFRRCSNTLLKDDGDCLGSKRPRGRPPIKVSKANNAEKIWENNDGLRMNGRNSEASMSI